MLNIENVSKSFGAFKALDRVSITLEAGQAVGIMGVNGAGKSTLLNCICGFLQPDEGKIVLDHANINGLRPNKVAGLGLGRTFQIPRSFRGLTVLENLLVISAHDASGKDQVEIAHEVLKRVKLDHVASNYASELSGGQQKLLELARVMLLKPKVVLLDEPFAGVHSDLCRLFIDEINALLKASVAVLIVCHDPGTLYRMSKKIVVMHEGRVLCSGPPESIQNNPEVVEAYLGTSH